MRGRSRVTAALVVVVVAVPAAAVAAWDDTARLGGLSNTAFVVARPVLVCTPAAPQAATVTVVRWEAQRVPGTEVAHLDHVVTASSGPAPAVVVGPDAAARRVELNAQAYGTGLARGASRRVVLRVEARLPGVASWAASAEEVVVVSRSRMGMDRTTVTCS